MDAVFYKLIPLLPFLAFLVVGLGGHWIKSRAHLIAVPAVLGSLLLSILALLEAAGGKNAAIPLYTWMTSGDLTIELGLYVDPLRVAMLVLGTRVSSLVHICAIGFVGGEKVFVRCF